MKKFIFSAVAIIVFSCGCLWAQNSALKITADEIRIEKPLSANTFTFQLSYCGLTISNGSDGSLNPLPWPL